MVPSLCVSSDRAKSGQVGKSSVKGFVSFGRVIVSSRPDRPQSTGIVSLSTTGASILQVNQRATSAWRDNGSVCSSDRELSE